MNKQQAAEALELLDFDFEAQGCAWMPLLKSHAEIIKSALQSVIEAGEQTAQPDVMGAVDCIKAFINCSDRNGNHDSDVDKRVRASIDTIEAALRSPGRVMVPVEPTEEMIDAAINRAVPEDDLYSGVYRAMIAARPKGE